ncbi:MAG: RluA family pseudouridine synthase [Bacteroidales bacterium]|nr:RluA family pseudouridine synthase [Bacteroidales bacterium]MDD2322414.1 RluA family pseudouridine synthase [Bacteroidales bacterium]MDD3011402.1 RluA family pseudouridine synthase [Bacteroidales bacterium]MDD3961007.1 RluA family pseudouridine synthase [Bacteroidales bacterium]MDY0284594.1 RluA family pseudouridine synthase [Bacteroidales bacterium]
MQNNKPGEKYSGKNLPAGLTILYEDRDILVINKPAGLLTISTAAEKSRTAYHLLTDYVKKGNPRSFARIFIVHRIDRDTSGVLVFARSEEAKLFLQEHWQDFHKTYFAVVMGKLAEPEGEISSYLCENSIFRVYSVKDPEKGKLARTGYKVLKEANGLSLLEVKLLTGRKHQIRVHLSEMGHPVAGDKVYGDKAIKGIKLALHAASLTLIHPFSKKEMTFETGLPLGIKSLVKQKQPG